MDWDNHHESVLRRYSRAVVHLRSQFKLERFGLMLGAGVSRSFGIPNWADLVEELAKDEDVSGEGVLRASIPSSGLPYRTEVLFEHYKSKRYAQEQPEHHNTRRLDYEIGSSWRAIIQKHLYGSTAIEITKETISHHEYFASLIPLAQKSQMTVTYNFDDVLETAMMLFSDDKSKGCETVTNPWTQFRLTNGIIYHPNGTIFRNNLEIPSDTFVFSEASYAEQLIGIYAGDQSNLVNHLSKNTCLLVGLSLNDETLRNALSRSAKSCPGGYHYYIHYMNGAGDLDPDQKKSIQMANFNVYNLITLFLTAEEINALCEMINVHACEKDDFCDQALVHEARTRFCYYITGALGVGKTTTINHFRNLNVFDEWLEERPEVLAKDWEELTPEEKEFADSWILNQFKLKNDKLRNEKEGVFLLDRGPLDPLAFTPKEEWPQKADSILNTLCPNGQWKVESGRVVFLEEDTQELSLRMLYSQRKHYTAEKLGSMADSLKKAYGTDNIAHFNTEGLSTADVANRIAEIIHLEEYTQPCNLHERLETIRDGGANAAEQESC